MLKRSFLMAALVGLACCDVRWCRGQEPAAGEAPETGEASVTDAPTATNPITVYQDLGNGRFQAVLQAPETAPSAAAAALNEIRFTTDTFQNPLGIEVAPIDPALRAQLALQEGCGVVVTSVVADSAVAQAGLQAFDIVLEIDDQTVGSPEAFQELTSRRQGAARFDLLRQGKPLTVEATLPEVPHYAVMAKQFYLGEAFNQLLTVQVDAPHYRIGVTLSEADDTLRSQLRLAAGEGLVVTDVVADSPAAAAGIRTHDVLAQLDGKRLTTTDAVNAQIQEIQERAVTVLLFRGGQEVSLSVAPQLTNAETGGLIRVITAVAPDGSVQHAPSWRHVVVAPLAPAAEGASDAAAQLAELKKQVEALQATLQALEAALQAPPPAEAAPAAGEVPATP